MNTIMSKICLSLLICSLLSIKEVCSQPSCSWPPPEGDFTNGPCAELITANDGVSLLGIRVLWTIKFEYLNCQFSTPRVELDPDRHRKDITVSNSSADFYNLNYNKEYTPIVIMKVSEVAIPDYGDSLLFGASTATRNTAPSQLLRVCAGPYTSSLTRVNISWDLLSCHLQNGAAITGYIIQYSPTSGGAAHNISSSDSQVDCGVESGGRYRCSLPYSLFTTEVSYSFQVAAVNRYGTGQFSEQVIGMIPNQNETSSFFNVSDEANTEMPEINEDTTSPEVVTSEISFTTLQLSQTNSDSTEITDMLSVNTHFTEDITSPENVTSEKSFTSLHPSQTNSDYTGLQANNNITGLIAGVIGAVSILLLGVVVVVVVMIFAKIRNKRKYSLKRVAEYEMVKGPEHNNLEGVEKIKPGSKASTVSTKPFIDNVHDRSENEKDTDTKFSAENALYERVAEPKIIEFQPEVHVSEGEQATLRVNFTGTPKPTITWTFKDNKMEGDYATELGSDGSLMFVCVEMKHAGRYDFEVGNSIGCVQGSMTLVVQEGEEERDIDSRMNFDNNEVKQAEFGEYVASLHSCNNSTFILQYQCLVSGEDGHEITVGKSETNKPLNRFRNITAYDDHRVSLVPLPNFNDCQNTYINASYVDGYSQKNKYIAAQGPLPNTLTDFWRMVWQEKVRNIAMVTNVKEGRTKKCEQYWPEGSTVKSFGSFNVTVVEQHVFADYVIRHIQLVHTGERGSSRKVTQYHFTSWPDHGVPEYAGPILNYLRRIKAQHKPNKGPILVHCSAGIGRTGTLIAIDVALAQASKERQVDIPKIIVDMRKQRMKMVQTVEQYAFIHDAVLETLICGDTQIPASDLRRSLDQLKKADKHFAGKTGFQKQFQVLDQVSPKATEVFCESAMKNPTKNRSNDFLPPEKWRVTLKGDTSDYIHASFANGYKQKKGFIIAQSPMKNTVRDFVKMIYERECGVVVMLCGCEEGGVEMCAQYWPTSAGSVKHYGEFLVSTVSINTNDGVTQRVVTITDPKSGQIQKVTQFHVEQWSDEGMCLNPQALVEVFDQMGVVQRRTGNKPIVVHGNDTVSRVGVFCCLVNAIEMCKTEGVVDVFQVVKALRIQKPGAVLTVDQHQFIFDLVVLFLDSFSVYSNFK